MCLRFIRISCEVSAMQTNHSNGGVAVATNIRVELARQNLNQTDLAEKLGVYPQWVQRRLSGETKISVDDITAIADALDISVVDLLPAKAAS